jgi:hypothetical protein
MLERVGPPGIVPSPDANVPLLEPGQELRLDPDAQCQTVPR